MLSICKKEDGTLTGKWGRDELSDVKFEDGKLTFIRTIKFGEQKFTMNYNSVLKNGTLEGLLSSDRGEFTVKGTRKKSKLPVLGRWDIHFKVEVR